MALGRRLRPRCGSRSPHRVSLRPAGSRSATGAARRCSTPQRLPWRHRSRRETGNSTPPATSTTAATRTEPDRCLSSCIDQRDGSHHAATAITVHEPRPAVSEHPPSCWETGVRNVPAFISLNPEGHYNAGPETPYTNSPALVLETDYASQAAADLSPWVRVQSAASGSDCRASGSRGP